MEEVVKESIINFNLKANEVIVKRSKIKQHKGYYMVGKQTWVNVAPKEEKPSYELKGIDFIDIFTSISKREQRVVKLVKDHIRWNDDKTALLFEVNLSPDSLAFSPKIDDYTAYDVFLKGYNALFKKDLMRRTKQHHYMLTPEFLLPSGALDTYYTILWSESRSVHDKKK